MFSLCPLGNLGEPVTYTVEGFSLALLCHLATISCFCIGLAHISIFLWVPQIIHPVLQAERCG